LRENVRGRQPNLLNRGSRFPNDPISFSNGNRFPSDISVFLKVGEDSNLTVSNDITEMDLTEEDFDPSPGEISANNVKFFDDTDDNVEDEEEEDEEFEDEDEEEEDEEYEDEENADGYIDNIQSKTENDTVNEVVVTMDDGGSIEEEGSQLISL
jgi:hypothetical protein